MGVCESSNEAPGTTYCNAETSTICNLKLLKKNQEKKKKHFFSARVYSKELRYFALQSVHPGALFDLSNTPIQ